MVLQGRIRARLGQVGLLVVPTSGMGFTGLRQGCRAGAEAGSLRLGLGLGWVCGVDRWVDFGWGVRWGVGGMRRGLVSRPVVGRGVRRRVVVCAAGEGWADAAPVAAVSVTPVVSGVGGLGPVVGDDDGATAVVVSGAGCGVGVGCGGERCRWRCRRRGQQQCRKVGFRVWVGVVVVVG